MKLIQAEGQGKGNRTQASGIFVFMKNIGKTSFVVRISYRALCENSEICVDLLKKSVTAQRVNDKNICILLNSK